MKVGLALGSGSARGFPTLALLIVCWTKELFQMLLQVHQSER